MTSGMTCSAGRTCCAVSRDPPTRPDEERTHLLNGEDDTAILNAELREVGLGRCDGVCWIEDESDGRGEEGCTLSQRSRIVRREEDSSEAGEGDKGASVVM